jgi:hypothetical protein
MATTIANTSKETVSRLLWNEFEENYLSDNLDAANKVLQTAKDFQLHEVSERMQKQLDQGYNGEIETDFLKSLFSGFDTMKELDKIQIR